MKFTVGTKIFLKSRRDLLTGVISHITPDHHYHVNWSASRTNHKWNITYTYNNLINWKDLRVMPPHIVYWEKKLELGL